MRTVTLLAVALAVVATAAHAEPRKPTLPTKLALVQVYCAGPPPAPCAPAFAFASGTATLRSAKQPAPTRDPAGQKAGEVRLTGVTKDGGPFSGALAAEVVLRTTFGVDANGNCELARVQIEVLSLNGAIGCRSGRCAGRLVPVAALPGHCADIAITSELVSLVVKDDAGRSLASVGIGVPAGRADAP